MTADAWASVGAVAACVTLGLVVVQIIISMRQTAIMKKQTEIAAAQGEIQRQQNEAIERDRARRPRLVVCSPTEEDSEEERARTGVHGGKFEDDGWVRGRLELYVHNYGDGEARDISVTLFMPYDLSVYEHDGQTTLPSSYEITDLAVDPENEGLYDADRQLHRLKATFAGPFYPGATLPIGFVEVLSVPGTYPVKWRLNSSMGAFPLGVRLGVLSVTVYG